MKESIELLAQRIVDFIFFLLPRKRPSRQLLMDCRLVSHRGEHDNRHVRENTMAAFRAVATAGIWGIEFDLRWTCDLHPVVIHDPNCGRVFDVDLEVADVSLDELRRRLPEIPTLEEVVAEFGGSTHLMVELKRDRLAQDDTKSARLGKIFSTLQAGRDYHFLALQADLFAPVGFVERQACLLVAELELEAFSRQVIDQGYGGLCGQYLLMGNRLLRRHHAKGQKIGTGFAGSRQCFYRELNRGVDWIFSNRALKLEIIRGQLLDRH